MKIYRSIILLVVLYGCETCSLTLREERRLRMFENRVVRRIFGPRREEATGEWRRVHNDLYCSPNIVWVNKSRRMRQAGHIQRMGERRGAYRVLVGKPEGNNHLEDPDIHDRIILKSIFRRWDGGMDWIDLSQNTEGAGTCGCSNEPPGSIKCRNFLTSLEPVSFSRRTLVCIVS
jgi:hypothetical protein